MTKGSTLDSSFCENEYFKNNKVEVEYLKSDPSVSRIKGASRSDNDVGCIAMVGVIVMFFSTFLFNLKEGIRAVSLLKKGQLARGLCKTSDFMGGNFLICTKDNVDYVNVNIGLFSIYFLRKNYNYLLIYSSDEIINVRLFSDLNVYIDSSGNIKPSVSGLKLFLLPVLVTVMVLYHSFWTGFFPILLFFLLARFIIFIFIEINKKR